MGRETVNILGSGRFMDPLEKVLPSGERVRLVPNGMFSVPNPEAPNDLSRRIETNDTTIGITHTKMGGSYEYILQLQEVSADKLAIGVWGQNSEGNFKIPIDPDSISEIINSISTEEFITLDEAARKLQNWRKENPRSTGNTGAFEG